MRLSVKVAFAVLAGLAIFQIYTNYGSLLIYAGVRDRSSEGIIVNLKTQGEHFVFSLPKITSNSTSKSSVNQGKPLSVEVKKQSLSPSSALSENASLPLSAFWKDLDFLLSKNQTPFPMSQSANPPKYNASTASGQNLASFLQDSRLTATLQSYFKNMSYSDLQKFLAQYLNTSLQQKNATGLAEKFGVDDSPGVIFQEGSKLLLSSVPGQVKLPVVNSSTAGDSLPACPDTPPNLAGLRSPVTASQKVAELEKRFSFLGAGGDYHPKECRPQQRVALIIPYRNRWDHLHVLLNNLIPFMVRQQVSFTIFVIEQEPPSTFNRALLLNIGILEASLRDLYTCFILHDVDLIPLHDQNLYRCSQQPKHFAVGINKFRYALPYGDYFGGVTGLSREQVEKINGNSNLYFGWGGEDDELLYRVSAKGMKVVRHPPQIGRYDMFKHGRDHGNEANPVRFELLKTTSKRMDQDGLNSLQYNVTSVEIKPLYTWIKVAVDPRLYVESAPTYVKQQLLKSLKLK